MFDRARALAGRFEQASEEFAVAMAGLSDAEWRTLCPGEERTVAALAHHVAFGYAVEVPAFRAMAFGEPVETWTRASLDRVNAAQGQEYAECDQAETVALLRREAAAAAGFVRSLTDEQLDRSGVYLDGLPAWTVEQWITRVLTGHPVGHLASIRAALAD
ncbi:MAG TPA: DinB family protein [Thermomicrobiaceae bacterium]|nr:DinB family protein [Thermomicrobiaceae bacterium]